jgi:hypothetical protein
MKPYKKHKYYSEFFTSFTFQFELLPRISFGYHKLKIDLIAIEWLWFGFYLQIFEQ